MLGALDYPIICKVQHIIRNPGNCPYQTLKQALIKLYKISKESNEIESESDDGSVCSETADGDKTLDISRPMDMDDNTHVFLDKKFEWF